MPEPSPELVGRWRAAEGQLYPTVLTDPQAYQRYVLAVRGLADELSEVAGREALAAAYPGAAARAAEHLRLVGGPDDPRAADLVAGAAFAMAERRVSAAQAAAARVERIAEAALRGEMWVVVLAAGDRALAPFGGYRSLEMHLPDGAGISVHTEAQPERALPVYVVERWALDPGTGVPVAAEPERRWTFTDTSAWWDVAEAQRAALDSRAERGEDKRK